MLVERISVGAHHAGESQNLDTEALEEPQPAQLPLGCLDPVSGDMERPEMPEGDRSFEAYLPRPGSPVRARAWQILALALGAVVLDQFGRERPVRYPCRVAVGGGLQVALRLAVAVQEPLLEPVAPFSERVGGGLQELPAL